MPFVGGHGGGNGGHGGQGGGGPGPGPGIHGGGPRGGPKGGQARGGAPRGGQMSRSGGMFSGMAHVGFGGQGIFGHIFGTRATANTGTYYDTPEERYATEYLEKIKRRTQVMSQTNQPVTQPSPDPTQPAVPQPDLTPISEPPYPDFINNRTTFLSSHYLAYLSAILIGMNIIANILGAQMWRCGLLYLDCGVIAYPFVYVALDVINEIYREKIANRIVSFACIINVLCIGAFALAGFLLKTFGTGADNTMVITAFGFSSRVFAASTVSFAFSALVVNNPVYERLRRHSQPYQIGFRALISSLLAKIADSFVFTLIAFFGRVDWNLLFYQFLWSMIVAWILEFCCTPVKIWFARRLKRNLGIDDD